MSEADIKLEIIRLIDSQKGSVLKDLFQLIKNKISQENELSILEVGYKEMSEDNEREEEAFEWIEGTLNSDDI